MLQWSSRRSAAAEPTDAYPHATNGFRWAGIGQDLCHAQCRTALNLTKTSETHDVMRLVVRFCRMYKDVLCSAFILQF